VDGVVVQGQDGDFLPVEEDGFGGDGALGGEERRREREGKKNERATGRVFFFSLSLAPLFFSPYPA
jgi:hypothetical protein